MSKELNLNRKLISQFKGVDGNSYGVYTYGTGRTINRSKKLFQFTPCKEWEVKPTGEDTSGYLNIQHSNPLVLTTEDGVVEVYSSFVGNIRKRGNPNKLITCEFLGSNNKIYSCYLIKL